MPLYEYACQQCDHHFDVRHGVDDAPPQSCPECAGDIKKVFHPAGIIFKGSGWHIKDYAKGGNGGSTLENAEKKEEKAEEKKDEKKEEKKEPVAAATPAAE